MTFNLLNENKMMPNNMSKKETKAELLKNIRLELFKKKKIIPAKTFTTLSSKLYTLEFSKKNNMKSIENFFKKEIEPLTAEVNTKGKLKENKKEVKKATESVNNLSSQLSSQMWTINIPKKYDHCISALNACPIMKSSTETKVKTYYFYNIQSLSLDYIS